METRREPATLDGFDVRDPAPDPGDDLPTDAYLGLRKDSRAGSGHLHELRRIKPRPGDHALSRG